MNRTPLQLIDLRNGMIDVLQVEADYGFDPDEEGEEEDYDHGVC